jgi:hypothetical protein
VCAGGCAVNLRGCVERSWVWSIFWLLSATVFVLNSQLPGKTGNRKDAPQAGPQKSRAGEGAVSLAGFGCSGVDQQSYSTLLLVLIHPIHPLC